MAKTNVSAKLDYATLLGDFKQRIQHAQTRALLAVNAELVRLYWDIGRLIEARQSAEGWGAGVIPGLSRDLRNELPEIKGLSERNIGRMISFHRAYPSPGLILPQLVAKLPAEVLPQAVAKTKPSAKVPQPVAQITDSLLWSIPWSHHAMLLEKIDSLPDRLWHMAQTEQNGWSRNVLAIMIQSAAHHRHGKTISNFDQALPAPQSDLIQQALKDPYIFDFLTLEEPFHERELETNLLHHLEKFLLELGQGFAFVGRQHRIEVSGDEFSIDLLFYHLRLRAFVVIDLKTGKFKPEYAGKMNFYLGVIDDQLRHKNDSPSIGLILCRERDRVIAEYALRDTKKPIGISQYELTRALPKEFESRLPSIEAIEAELAGDAAKPAKQARKKKIKKLAKKAGRPKSQ